MSYELHPEAAREHEAQVKYYEERSPGLGARYHASFVAAMAQVCEKPERLRIIIRPNIHRVGMKGFPFYVIYRSGGSKVQVLAVAPHRKRPGYWKPRL